MFGLELTKQTLLHQAAIHVTKDSDSLVAPTSYQKLHTLSLSIQEISGSFQKILPLVVMAVECEVTSWRGFGPLAGEYQDRQATDMLAYLTFFSYTFSCCIISRCLLKK